MFGRFHSRLSCARVVFTCRRMSSLATPIALVNAPKFAHPIANTYYNSKHQLLHVLEHSTHTNHAFAFDSGANTYRYAPDQTVTLEPANASGSDGWKLYPQYANWCDADQLLYAMAADRFGDSRIVKSWIQTIAFTGRFGRTIGRDDNRFAALHTLVAAPVARGADELYALQDGDGFDNEFDIALYPKDAKYGYIRVFRRSDGVELTDRGFAPRGVDARRAGASYAPQLWVHNERVFFATQRHTAPHLLPAAYYMPRIDDGSHAQSLVPPRGRIGTGPNDADAYGWAFCSLTFTGPYIAALYAVTRYPLPADVLPPIPVAPPKHVASQSRLVLYRATDCTYIGETVVTAGGSGSGGGAELITAVPLSGTRTALAITFNTPAASTSATAPREASASQTVLYPLPDIGE